MNWNKILNYCTTHTNTIIALLIIITFICLFSLFCNLFNDYYLLVTNNKIIILAFIIFLFTSCIIGLLFMFKEIESITKYS